VDVLRIDFLDLLLDLANQLCAGRHSKYLESQSGFNTSESVAPHNGNRGALSDAPAEDPDLDMCGSPWQKVLL
jgi:hypothetical protein